MFQAAALHDRPKLQKKTKAQVAALASSSQTPEMEVQRLQVGVALLVGWVSAAEGEDQLSNVEILIFRDGRIDLPSPLNDN